MTGLSPQVPRNEERDTTLRDLVAVVFKRKWMILGIVAGVTALVVWQAMTAADTYSADARVMIKRQGARASELDRTARQLPWTEVVESEIELLQSAPVFQKAQEMLAQPSEHFPEGIKLGIFQIAGMIDVGIIGESNVLYIQSTAETPRMAIEITNAVAEAYVAVHADMFALPETGGFIRARADSVMGELEALQNEKASLLQVLGVTELGQQEQALIRGREGLRAFLVELQQDVSKRQTELEAARTLLQEKDPVIPFEFITGTVQGATVNEMLTLLRRERANLESLQQKYTEQHPLVVESRRDIVRYENEVEEAMQQIVAMKEHELRVAERRMDAVVEEIDTLGQQLAVLPQARGRINLIDARIQDLERQHKYLADEAIASDVLSQSFEDYSVVIVSRALRAELNAGADAVRLALGPLLALMAALGLAFYLDNMDHSVSSRDDLERHFEIPVLASFPDADIEQDADTEPEPRRRIPFGRASRG